VLDGRLGAAAVGETVSNVGICRTFSRRAPSLCASDAHVMHNAATLLTIDPRGNRWQPTATDLACFSGVRARPICH
jgi:hypothetical protein